MSAHLDRLSQVRSCVERIAAEGDREGAGILKETFLIRDNFYCGRSFETETLRAVWFHEENELKVHDRESGSLVRVLRGDDIPALAAEIAIAAAPADITIPVVVDSADRIAGPPIDAPESENDAAAILRMPIAKPGEADSATVTPNRRAA